MVGSRLQTDSIPFGEEKELFGQDRNLFNPY